MKRLGEFFQTAWVDSIVVAIPLWTAIPDLKNLVCAKEQRKGLDGDGEHGQTQCREASLPLAFQLV